MFSFFKCCKKDDQDKKLIHKVVMSVTDYQNGNPMPTKYYGTFFYDNGTRESKQVSELDSHLFHAEKAIDEIKESVDQSFNEIKDSLDRNHEETKKYMGTGAVAPFVGFIPFNKS